MTGYFQMNIKDGTAAGERVRTACRRFSHTIGGQKFWFALHAVEGRTCKVISHVASGRKVCDSLAGFTNVSYSKHDELAIARQSLDRLAGSAGAARMRSVLSAAEAPVTNAQKDAT
ncbi:hypothetical protein P3T23_004550 [Paraburkholderia sp. GAS448]|uniref:hypothetical protein n=1 Tax=Paraburkholderia sp. GAS448 TaxID=3035136 RepID=UPI003D19B4C1